MELKYTFDEAVSNYDKRRPTYDSEVFKDIISYANLTPDKSVIEIGCGTGQATEPFLKTDCKVTAVELGKNLATYTEEKFKQYEKFEVVNTAFETFESVDEQYDMLYCATAFHWIPDNIGYQKVYKLLKEGGTLALFWNKPSPSEQDSPLHDKIQSIYRELLPEWGECVMTSEEKNRKYDERKNKIKQYGFENLQFKLYHYVRKMSATAYIELLNTYSNHLVLEESIQTKLYDGIRNAIESFGDEIIINNTVDLYLAQKTKR